VLHRVYEGRLNHVIQSIPKVEMHLILELVFLLIDLLDLLVELVLPAVELESFDVCNRFDRKGVPLVCQLTLLSSLILVSGHLHFVVVYDHEVENDCNERESTN